MYVDANEAVVAKDAVVANEAVVGVNVIEVAADAVIALFAQLLVPNNDPVRPPLANCEAPEIIKEPESIVLPVTSNWLKLPVSVKNIGISICCIKCLYDK
jgi:hypothetical protein